MPSLMHVLVAVHDVKMTDASNATIVFSTNYHTKYKNKARAEMRELDEPSQIIGKLAI